MNRIRPLAILLALAVSAFAPLAHAQGLIPNPDNRGSVTQRQLPCYDTATKKQIDCANVIAGDFVGALTDQWNSMFKLVFFALGAVAVLMLIYAGIQYILASQTPDAAKKARQNLINVSLGIVLLSASYGIIRLAVAIGKAISP